MIMGTLWKNNFNFVREVSMIYANFIITVVLRKKLEALLSYRVSVNVLKHQG